ncbi:hypothetical protein LZ023_40010 (plasmid) [Pseudomonas silvicola]|nr:hypothetical protein LZ023_40010 [Pseudomonas silvicola]
MLKALLPATSVIFRHWCAALNRTNINTQLLTIEAAVTGKKEHIYHAALLDPHTYCGAFHRRYDTSV